MTTLDTTKLPNAEKIKNESRFLKAARGEKTDAVPIWLMRQAGRYMAEYRELRKTYGILDIIKTPELARDVTMQPINAFDLDAAIIFADILPPLQGMGLNLEFIKGEGPVIHNPVRTASDVDALIVPPAEEALWFTLDAIKLTREALDPKGVPLIGFSGAPFTLASYAIEGGASKNKIHLKSLMYSDKDAWHKLMTKLAQCAGDYLLAQAKAGAQALQLFDSWVGELSPQDYRQYVQPYSKQALEMAKDAGVPLIHFGTNTNGMLTDIRDAGGDVIGVDWRIDIDKASQILGDGVAIQGNLDPVALYAPWDELQARAKDVLDRMQGRDGYIFNLGHGIIKTTPPENVKRLVDFVHEYSSQQSAVGN
ncbi:MAG: uroporphyrinogen decarboxylase [Chloroflexota bacterium]